MIRTAIAMLALVASALPAHAQPVMRKCAPYQPNTPTKTCVVDGDTIWLNGNNYRMVGYDTPEPQTNICGGQREVELANRATSRLIELLNSNAWTLTVHPGTAGYGRGAATITINGRDVGDILIAEGLARSWPNGREFWCE